MFRAEEALRFIYMHFFVLEFRGKFLPKLGRSGPPSSGNLLLKYFSSSGLKPLILLALALEKLFLHFYP